ncbi:hypothetical protein Q3G72_030060 [Acer saccharum]|nr:hypothetical protein Q3G72_030060 [Acer saccharum]
MDVRIISREIIKPSSSTPYHLRTYKLSGLDQQIINGHIPIVFFYSTAPKSCEGLKKSLSEILTHYYPLAGRLKDYLSIDCDDSGVSLVEARVAGNMSDVLKQPEIDPQEQLLPCKVKEFLTSRSILAVQVSYFDCGGVAICLFFRHVCVDATAAANFIKSWAAITACGGIDFTVQDVIFDCTSIFPPIDDSVIPENTYTEDILYSLKENVRRRFVLEGSKISALQEKIGNRPTRFEAVFALMLGAITAGQREGNGFTATFPVNLRKRMNPPIPEQCIGNIHTIVQTNRPREETTNYSSLTAKVRELISMVNGEYVKQASPNGWLLRKDAEKDRDGMFIISSWCTLPLYETDFGWGKPTVVVPIGRLNSGDHIAVVLLDTGNDKGIEAWVSMSKESMDKFEQDSGVIAYASLI